MICVIALVVFGVLGIFSASYRKIAKEAFDCVFRRVTLRKCTSGLDKRLKSQITGKLMKRKPKTAKFVYKHFEIISWFFTILLLASLAYSAYGGYNYIVYGNCNGAKGGFCIYDVFSEKDGDSTMCGVPVDPTTLLKPNVSQMPYFGSDKAELEIIEFGCFSCPYSREAQKDVEKMLDAHKEDIKFYYIHFPIPSHTGSKEAAMASECARNQDAFWKYYARLFKMKTPVATDDLISLAGALNLNTDQFRSCIETNATAQTVELDINLGHQSGIYGTPTFFIGNQTFIGPMSAKEFDAIIKEELSKN